MLLGLYTSEKMVSFNYIRTTLPVLHLIRQKTLSTLIQKLFKNQPQIIWRHSTPPSFPTRHSLYSLLRLTQPIANLQAANVMSYLSVAHECALDCVWLWSCGVSSAGDGGASFRGGMRSLIASKPLASAKLVILWFGENPCNAANTKLSQEQQQIAHTHRSWDWSCRPTAPPTVTHPWAWDP